MGDNMTVGEIIKLRRKELRLSQASLGKMIETNDADISRIEKGSSVSIEKLVKIAKVLELNLLDILASAGLYSDTSNSNTRLISDEDFAFLTKVDLEYIRCFIHALVEKRKGSQQ